MCGRFTLTASAEALKEIFPLFDLASLQPRFNVAPTQNVAAIRRLADAPTPECVWLRWGLIPSWAEDKAIGNRLINARAETVADKPSFRAAFKQRRCLILADGFYEWQKLAGGKQPFYIRRRDGKPFAFAGLWERWDKGDEPLQTCTILTTAANDLMRPIHERMPVILPDAIAHDRWLDPTPKKYADLQDLLVPLSTMLMTAIPIGTHVNNPRHDDPQCVVAL